tara:strand:- start:1475 stop:2428 length:954 start_codon:yes stop_codon:yes gene_type:complete
MNIQINKHIPVMINQAIEFLPHKDNLNVIDATFGGGGYSKHLLMHKNINNLIAIDRDPLAKIFANKLKNKTNFKFIEGQFSKIDQLVSKQMNKKNFKGFDAIFFDLGMSSNQIEDNKRGFSFQIDGPLDMRMSGKGFSAYDLINNFSEVEIANILFKYGQEKYSRSIAKKIVENRKTKNIHTTEDLIKIIKNTIRLKSKKHPATKVFQALRIYINNELQEISDALKKSEKLLLPGGRIIVVSFHSLEDKLVKEYFNHKSGKKWRSSRHNPEPSDTGQITLKIITKKAIKPDNIEIASNPRCRSARLRVAEKIMDYSL